MRALLLRLAEMGKTLIVTSHILPELSRICDTVAIITEGKLRAFGTLDEIMRKITQRRTFEVQLADNDHVSEAQRVVSGWLGADAGRDVSSSPTEGLVRFETDRTDRELSSLLSGLLEQSLLVAQFREVPTDLEDAFLSVANADEGNPGELAGVSSGDGDQEAGSS